MDIHLLATAAEEESGKSVNGFGADWAICLPTIDQVIALAPQFFGDNWGTGVKIHSDSDLATSLPLVSRYV